MLFSFLKYLQPTHYFQLFRKDGTSIFPITQCLPKETVEQLVPELKFKSEIAKEYDLSWQAIYKGYIGDAETFTTFETLPIEDEYRFLRKYFHPGWVFYVLCLRLLTFHHPLKEIKGWLKTIKTVRLVIAKEQLRYKEWHTFKSSLITQQPLVSIVIPTLNRYEYLKDVLHDFEQQNYTQFEILIVDQSDPFHESFYVDFDLPIRLIRQEEKALWLARNTAVKAAKGELIALSEDDVRIPSDWISMHLKALDFFTAQVSAGVFYPQGQTIPTDRSFFTVAAQFATGNAMLFKTVFEKVGLFDRQFEKQRMGDGEFGLRVYLEGIKSVSNPYAFCIDMKASTGGLREMGSWDAFRSRKWLDPRPIPSVLYFYRNYYGIHRSQLGLLKTIPLSIMPYRYKNHKLYMVVGAFILLLIMPIILFQIIKSWRLSTNKINEGPLIELLN